MDIKYGHSDRPQQCLDYWNDLNYFIVQLAPSQIELMPQDLQVDKQQRDNSSIMPYQESVRYQKTKYTSPEYDPPRPPGLAVEEELLKLVLQTVPPNDPGAVIRAIDQFCQDQWMMNLGDEKAEIVVAELKKKDPKVLVEIGGYVGYSALVFAHNSNAQVHTVEVDGEVAAIARALHNQAGLTDRIHIHIGTVASEKPFLRSLGKADMVFIDHEKDLYLEDFLLLESYGLIGQGTVVIGDNMINPGSPQYMEHFKGRQDYESTLYHSFVEYSAVPDAVLVSIKITQ